MPTKEEIIIVSSGEISKKDAQFIIRFLGRFGLKSQITDPESYRELVAQLNPEKRPPYFLDDISSKDQYLLKEHFAEFRTKYASQYSKRISSSAFFHTVGAYADGRKKNPILSVLECQLATVSRSDIGLATIDNDPKNNYVYNNRAVQVGIFLDFADRLKEEIGEWEPRQTETFLMQFSERLRAQIDSASDGSD